FKQEPKVNGAAREVAREPAGDDELCAVLFTREGLARVLILGRGFGLPLLDGGTTLVGMPFVLNNGILGETVRNGLPAGIVSGEVSGDRFWQIESHGFSLQCERNRATALYRSDTWDCRP